MLCYVIIQNTVFTLDPNAYTAMISKPVKHMKVNQSINHSALAAEKT